MKKSLYENVYDDIYFSLQNGTYKPGDKLASEKEMEILYKVSKTTIRKALDDLENEGLIYRIQGMGSFVSEISPPERWTLTTGFGSYYSREWSNISAKTITIDYIKSKKYSEKLEISENSKIIYMERVRYINSKPLVYMEHYIKPIVPIDIFIVNTDFVSAAGKMIKSYLNKNYSKVIENIQAIVANDYIANCLDVYIGHPVLKISRYSYIEQKLVDINIYYVRTDMWEYTVEYNGENIIEED